MSNSICSPWFLFLYLVSLSGGKEIHWAFIWPILVTRALRSAAVPQANSALQQYDFPCVHTRNRSCFRASKMRASHSQPSIKVHIYPPILNKNNGADGNRDEKWMYDQIHEFRSGSSAPFDSVEKWYRLIASIPPV